jgi:hypothetical protein
MKSPQIDVQQVFMDMYSPNRFKANISAMRSEIFMAQKAAGEGRFTKSRVHIENVSLICIDAMERLEEMKGIEDKTKSLAEIIKQAMGPFSPEGQVGNPEKPDGRKRKSAKKPSGKVVKMGGQKNPEAAA